MARRLPAAEPDCRRCGACCVAAEDVVGHADILEDDAARLLSGIGRGRFARLVAVDRGAAATRVRRGAGGHLACAAHRGEPGRSSSCSVYDHRPGVCRSLVPGSRRCLEARTWFEDEAGRRLA